MHGIAAQHDRTRAGAFEALCRLREAVRRIAPAARILHLLDLLEIIGVHQQRSRMQLALAVTNPLIDELVIERSALPTHATDQANRPHPVSPKDSTDKIPRRAPVGYGG